MAIDIKTTNPALTGTTPGKSTLAARNRTPGGSDASADDTLELTHTVSILKHAERLASSMPIVDSREVEGVKQALRDGRYEINSGQVADRIVEMEQSLSD